MYIHISIYIHMYLYKYIYIYMQSARSAQCPAGRAEFDVMLNYQAGYASTKFPLKFGDFPGCHVSHDTGGKKKYVRFPWMIIYQSSTNSIQFHVLVDVSQVEDPTNPKPVVNPGYQPGDRVVPFRLSHNSRYFFLGPLKS